MSLLHEEEERELSEGSTSEEEDVQGEGGKRGRQPLLKKAECIKLGLCHVCRFVSSRASSTLHVTLMQATGPPIRIRQRGLHRLPEQTVLPVQAGRAPLDVLCRIVAPHAPSNCPHSRNRPATTLGIVRFESLRAVWGTKHG